VFGKLFGRGKPTRDAFGVATSGSDAPGTQMTVVPATETTVVPGTETTVTTTSFEIPSHDGANFGALGTDLGALLKTVRDVQAQAGGDREAMAEILRERLGGGEAVVIDQQSATDRSVGTQNQDPIALLATLSELHEKGVVSDEQFEAQKRRLLG
jgi:hypothetical protein